MIPILEMQWKPLTNIRVEKLNFELLRHKFTTLVIVVALYEEGEVKMNGLSNMYFVIHCIQSNNNPLDLIVITS